jgi:hypothetical protein
LHLVGVPYYFTYIDDARSNTNQVYWYIRKYKESDEPKNVQKKIRRNRNEMERHRKLKIKIYNTKQELLTRDRV